MAYDCLERMFGGQGGGLGRDVETRRNVQIRHPERSTYIIGAHGTGKSTLLLNLILSDIERSDKGVVVLDPHGPLAEDVILRCPPDQAHRVVYFSPVEQQHRPFGLNPFEIHDPTELEQRFEGIMTTFTHLWYGTFAHAPKMQNTLETLARTLLVAYPKYQTHWGHMLLLLQGNETGGRWRERLAATVSYNEACRMNWERWQEIKYLRQDTQSSEHKINHIMQNDIIRPILCQPKSSSCFHLQKTLGAKKIIVVNLKHLDEEGKKLLGSIILTQLVTMAFLRSDPRALVPCHIYADEFYYFAPAAFVKIINECRKFKLFVTIAHQTLAQLPEKAEAAAGNCANKVIFRVNSQDARRLKANFILDDTFPEHGLSELPLYEALVRVEDKRERVSRQAWVKTFPERGEPNHTVAAMIRKQSEVYGRSTDRGGMQLTGRQEDRPVVTTEEQAQEPASMILVSGPVGSEQVPVSSSVGQGASEDRSAQEQTGSEVDLSMRGIPASEVEILEDDLDDDFWED